ncbi:hypothetical protein C5S31_12425 [ANME-1 cluster archaeon GoMg2]|nr:hypothetical protein [ANME-1 cluster archaeon GoMg2]
MNIAKRLGALAIVGLFILSSAVSTVIASGQAVEAETQIGSQEAVSSQAYTFSRGEYRTANAIHQVRTSTGRYAKERAFVRTPFNMPALDMPTDDAPGWQPPEQWAGDAEMFTRRDGMMEGINQYLLRAINDSQRNPYSMFPPENTTTVPIPEGATTLFGWRYPPGSDPMMEGINMYLFRAIDDSQSYTGWQIFQ